MLREHNGEVFGSLVAGAGNPRNWGTYAFVAGTHTEDEISLTVIVTDGCGHSKPRTVIVKIKGVVKKDVVEASIHMDPMCVKDQGIVFHKE